MPRPRPTAPDDVEIELRPEGVAFAPSRVETGHGRPMLLVAAFVALLGGLAYLGLSGGPTPPTTGPTATSRPLTAAVPALPVATPLGDGLGSIELHLGSNATVLLVHGVLPDRSIVRVAVSLVDADGSVADSQTLNLPGPTASAGPEVAPGPSFDLRFRLPADAPTRALEVRATGFDVTGQAVAVAIQPVIDQAVWITLNVVEVWPARMVYPRLHLEGVISPRSARVRIALESAAAVILDSVIIGSGPSAGPIASGTGGAGGTAFSTELNVPLSQTTSGPYWLVANGLDASGVALEPAQVIAVDALGHRELVPPENVAAGG
jgi:hypothetical protein